MTLSAAEARGLYAIFPMSSREPSCYLAFDLGASTSRSFLGTLKDNVLVMNELHRFITPVLEIGEHLFWDLNVLWEELQTGLEKALGVAPRLRSISVDSWGVDYVSLDASGHPIRNPFCYRDPRTEGIMDRAFSTASADEIYEITGIQFLPFNTVYQLLADAEGAGVGEARDTTDADRTRRDTKKEVSHHLPIADYFNFRFSGRRAVEVSMASTTQMMDVHTRQWSSSLMGRLGLDVARWPEIIPSGTRLAPALLAPKVVVVATCSHDTGSAVAAAPAIDSEEHWAFISCGTWSLLGVERRSPLLSREAREAGFTNEAGLDGTIRLLKNLTGLWVLQECTREWRSSSVVNWDDLERKARAARLESAHTGDAAQSDTAPSYAERSHGAFIDLEDGRFLARGNMEDRMHNYCRENSLPALKSRGEIVFAILSSMADSYRRTLSELERITGTTYERIHLFGGGSQNALLCQLTADACRTEVVAGPVEAAAMGNLLIQARSMGDLPDGMSIRDIASESSHPRVYSPVLRPGNCHTAIL